MTCRLVAITPFAVTKKPEPVAVGKPGVDRRMNTTLLRTSAGWKGAPSAGSAAASLSPTGGWGAGASTAATGTGAETAEERGHSSHAARAPAPTSNTRKPAAAARPAIRRP